MSTVVNEIVGVLKQGNKVLICGNGGLAAEAEHFAAELVGKFGSPVFLPCIALTGPSSLITALANDFGYEEVFAHQVKVLGNPGDCLLGLTTSASPNILKALQTAKAKGLKYYLIDSDMIPGETVGEKQQSAIALLHDLARKVKLAYAGS